MIQAFKAFFRFSGDHASTWRNAIILEFIRGMAGMLQVLPLCLVLFHLVQGTVTLRLALISFGLVLLAVVLETGLHYAGYKMEMQANYLMLDDKRIAIGDRLRYLPMGFFNESRLGDLTAVCTSTMESIESLAGSVVVRVVTGILHAVVFSLGFMAIDWRIGCIFLAGVIGMMAVNARMIAVTQSHSQAHLDAQVDLVDAVLEYIQGMSVVRSFNLSDGRSTSFREAIGQAQRHNYNLEKRSIAPTALQQCILRFFSVVAVLAAIAFYFEGSMELFVCLLVVIGGFLVYSKIEMAGALSYQLPALVAAMKRVEDVEKTLVMESGDARPANRGDIEISEVRFSYEDRTVIDGVSLSIPAGSTCAIVGPSGSGKTTLMNLIARFWDVDAGSVRVDGVDVKAQDYDALMAKFAMVFQDVYLFNDSIENNIKFGCPEASHEDVVRVAKAARCHEFIESLPEGYATVVGEGGATVSGGEKQRISIARAFLKDAPIVLLDEATANVDPENEADLMAAVEALTRGKTVVMIAHRLKTVRNADQIVVLDAGRISALGTHEELMAQEGIYRDFVTVRERAANWKIA